jgi:short-subunit dehydrogenase
VYATSRSGETIQPTSSFPGASHQSAEIRPFKSALESDSDIAALKNHVTTEHGYYDAPVNNAGIYHYREGISEQERDEMFNLNYYGTLKVTQTFPCFPTVLAVRRNLVGR